MSQEESKPTLRIYFTDFWSSFVPENFWIYRILEERYKLIMDSHNPEILVFCDHDYGIAHVRYNCHKIFYSHEDRRPSPLLCDFSFSFHGRGGTHRYFSNLVEEEYFEDVRSQNFSPKVAELRAVPKTKFCNFIYSNPAAKERIKFCKELMLHRRVDCPAKVLNNCSPIDVHTFVYARKIEFLSNYRFTIAFENSGVGNYTTEKIIHPFIAGSIPVYWGNPRVAELFDSRSFINCHDYRSFHEVIEHILEVDQSPQKLLEYQRASPIPHTSPLAKMTPSYLRCVLHDIVEISRSGTPVSQQRTYPLRRGAYWLFHKARNRFVYSVQRAQEIVFGESSRLVRSACS